MLRLLLLLSCLLLSACAGYSGGGLKPGQDGEPEVRQRMGPPAMSWPLPGGRKQLAYPRGPAGFHTWMVVIDGQGRLESIDNALTPETFARIRPEMTQAEVLQLLGPSQPAWTAYFAARDELVWEWRYCDDWGEPARFEVLFDGTKKTVRTTYSRTESSFTRYHGVCAR